MAPAYRNATTGQTVISDEPRPDLEALARWDEIPMPEPEPAPAPPVGLGIAANSSVTSTTQTPGAAPATPPATGDADPVTPPVGDTVAPTPVDDGGPAKDTGDGTGDTGTGDGDETGDGTDTGDNDPESAPVPDTSWTDEALDALAEERGITYRSNASKATKVAKLTAPAGE